MISTRPILVALAVVAVCAGALADAGPPALGATRQAGMAGNGGKLLVDSVAPARPTSPTSAPALPALPSGWPSTHFELGLADAPGGAAALRAKAPFEFRYQYLAGGVNTGNGWATWNTNGQFVSYYVADSAANNVTPVFPYYQLLQSNPVVSGDEKARDLSHLANHTTMAAYYSDLRLFFTRAAGSTPVVLHIEPDLWGYIEQQTGTGDDATTVPASVASSGDGALGDLPNNASGFARAIVRLRDQLAPNVILAYHLSVWGTNWDISLSNNSNSEVDALAARAASFYQSLGASFDIAFTDIADRDADYKRLVDPRDGGAAWWDEADFARYARFVAGFVTGTGKRVVVWQIPLGNTKMRAQNDTTGHYQDNRVEWFLDDPTGTHLAVWRDAGAVALLYGGGAGGTTCACDGQNDGVTNPPAINNNTRTSLNADDDGGYFHERAAAYYAAGALTLVEGSGGGGAGGGGGGTPVAWRLSAAPSPTSVARRHSVTITTRVRASLSARGRIRVDIYGPTGVLTLHRTYAARNFKAGSTVTVRPSFLISSSRRIGKYTVRIRILSAIDGHTLVTKTSSRTFRVHA